MSNIWEGTYVWLWQADQVHDGNVDRMIEELKALGVTGVLIKYSDGNLIGDPVSQKFMADFKRLAPAFKAAGFVVGGWTYQYLTDVDGEVDALRQAVEAGADWIVLNGEKHIEGKSVQVAEYGRKVRQLFPNLKIGMSTYAIADYHPTVPFDAYNQFVDAWMPQMYWATIGWSVEKTFNMSKTSFEKFGKPILPTGQAYSEPPNIVCRSDDMARFVQLCRDAGLTHVSWWDWQHFDDEIRAGIRNNVLPVSQSGLDDIPDWAETAVNWVRNLNAKQQEILDLLAREAYAFAETAYSQLKGHEKLKQALDYLEAQARLKGIPFDAAQAKIAIEKAWLEIEGMPKRLSRDNWTRFISGIYFL